MLELAIWKLYQNSHHPFLEEVTLQHSPATLNDASQSIPNGVYTTLRTYGGNKILPFDDHIRRLEESASALGTPVSLDQGQIRTAMRQLVRDYPANEVRIRLSVDLESEMGVVYMALEPLDIPNVDAYRDGVHTVTTPYQRENPRAKQTAFIRTAESIRRKLPPGVNEAILVDEEGHLLEGLSSNFFAVVQDRLITPAEEILFGITRAIVLSSAEQIGVEVDYTFVSMTDIPLLQEAFLTSSSRSILPVRQIDDKFIHDGKPGPITRSLTDAFWKEIEKRLVHL